MMMGHTYSVIDIPGPIKHRSLAVRGVRTTGLSSLMQIPTVCLDEGDLTGSGGSLPLKYLTKIRM